MNVAKGLSNNFSFFIGQSTKRGGGIVNKKFIFNLKDFIFNRYICKIYILLDI